MFESKAGVMLIGGLGFFAFAFVSNALVPILMYQHLPETRTADLPNANLMYSFEDLSQRYPESFRAAYGKSFDEMQEDERKAHCAEALELGRKVYVGEGCWHCHSQFVRPVSNESLRFGPVSQTPEYQNELQRPVLFGTRRVGPDLSREGGRRSNDWHAVHFFRPKTLSHGSPMPDYPWLFDEYEADHHGSGKLTIARGPQRPNERGLALITYVQWLGSWLESYPYYEDYVSTDVADQPR